MANQVAYGFHGLKDVFASSAYQNRTLIPTVRDAIIATTAEHTRQVTELTSAIAGRTTEPRMRIATGDQGTLQPLDEWGNPKPTRGGGYYEIGFPIQGGGDAYGTNRVSRAKLSVQDVNDRVLSATRKDADWMMRHMLASLLDNASWTFTDADSAVGTLTIKPLANGDTDTYLFNGSTALATDDHYKAQAATIADAANPFPTDRKELDEHPGNAGPFVVYVPTNQVDNVAALTELIEKPDPAVIQGANADQLAGDGEIVRRFGNEVIGYLKTSRMWVVEWKRLPDNYILEVALGAVDPAIMMREYDAPELQGLFNEFNSPDGNLEEVRFLRYAGFGCFNRTAALVRRCGNGSYAVPTGYDAPLAI